MSAHSSRGTRRAGQYVGGRREPSGGLSAPRWLDSGAGGRDELDELEAARHAWANGLSAYDPADFAEPDEPAGELLPRESDGRAIGRVLERAGIALERAGLWVQRQAAELRWRRLRAWRRWGT